jgi:hypothetical protein
LGQRSQLEEPKRSPARQWTEAERIEGGNSPDDDPDINSSTSVSLQDLFDRRKNPRAESTSDQIPGFFPKELILPLESKVLGFDHHKDSASIVRGTVVGFFQENGWR